MEKFNPHSRNFVFTVPRQGFQCVPKRFLTTLSATKNYQMCCLCRKQSSGGGKQHAILEPYQDQSWVLFLYHVIFDKQLRKPQEASILLRLYRKGGGDKRGQDAKSQRHPYQQDLRILRVRLLICLPRPHNICGSFPTFFSR